MIKILLIEDNLEVRENTAELLELANYEVKTAENGKEGVTAAKAWIPELIICDIMMPVLDGYGVLFMLGKDPKTRNIPFIFLTAKADKSDFRKGMNLGADDYLTKPFEEMELLAAIEGRLKKTATFQQDFKNDEGGLENFFQNAKGLEQLKDLSDKLKVRSFKKKEIIYREGDYAGSTLLLRKGKMKTYRVNDDGKEYITGLYSAEEFVGYADLLQGKEHLDSAAALEDTEIIKIPREDFLRLIHGHRDVSSRFIKMLASEVKEKEERLVQLAYDSVRKRVAEALVLLQSKYAEESELDFNMAISRDDLASVVGASPESVIRTLSEFKGGKLVAVKGSAIRIFEPRSLEKSTVVITFSHYFHPEASQGCSQRLIK